VIFGQSVLLWLFYNISVETIRLMVNTEKEHIMSQKLAQILERLVEMFPRQDFQTRLDQYISARNPQSTSDIEHLEREFALKHRGGLL
jgi:hypothetical protein